MLPPGGGENVVKNLQKGITKSTFKTKVMMWIISNCFVNLCDSWEQNWTALCPNNQPVLTPVVVTFQVKAAFTRAYNKEVHLTPYSLQVVKKGRRGGGGDFEGGEEMSQENPESEDEGEGLKADAMIKVSAFKLWDHYKC